MKRPHNCPDHSCKVIHQLKNTGQDLSDPNPGESFVCFGKLSEMNQATHNGVEHNNDLCTCNYTPRLGLVRFFENIEDWQVLATHYSWASAKIASESEKR